MTCGRTERVGIERCRPGLATVPCVAGAAVAAGGVLPPGEEAVDDLVVVCAGAGTAAMAASNAAHNQRRNTLRKILIPDLTLYVNFRQTSFFSSGNEGKRWLPGCPLWYCASQIAMASDKRIQLLALDIDGTLLNSQKEITLATESVMQLLHEKSNVHVVLASARPPRTTLPFYRRLHLNAPMVNYNGALIYDPQTANVIMHRPLPLKTCQGITELARRLFSDVLVSGEILDHWYTDRLSDEYWTETSLVFGPDNIAPLEQWMTQPVTKLMFLGPPQHLREIAAAIGREFLHQVSMVQTEDYVLQIMHATVSKATALKVVAGELGITREHVMAIGDNANDVGMLTWAGRSVAMANSSKDALEAADHITDSNDEDGVAKAIMKYLLS